ncbi:MAG: hypothetical protein V2I54_07060 [Bacteroidales bacterium]|jgi:hypothetical protein|nr:hypothetical protein [Bacteroidales bacterium]
MNFREQLLAELSKRNIEYIASVVGEDRALFKELMDLIFTNEPYVSGRAAWVLETLWHSYPWMIEPFIQPIIQFLPRAKYNNQRRHFTKILSALPLDCLDEDHLGILIDCCFTWLEEPNYPPAVKVYSMQILQNFVAKEPTIASELIAIIEHQMEDATPGLQNRGYKTLKALYKLI